MVEIAKLNEHGLEWKNYIKQSIQVRASSALCLKTDKDPESKKA